MVIYVRNEIDNLDTCPECYYTASENPQKHFTEVCQQPHLLIWVKMREGPCWPAKLMSIYDNMAKVRFFQDKTNNVKVPIVGCLLYSRDPPDETTINQQKNSHLQCAIQVKKNL